MENFTSWEEEISVLVCGGSRGDEWSFKPEHGIKQIMISHSEVINSIRFTKADAHDASAADGDLPAAEPNVFGGDGGIRRDEVHIDFPSEFLTGLSGTYGHWGPDVVNSLTLSTNRTEYGPFGTELGNPFSFQAEGGVITGLHGRAGSYLDAIGVFLKPACSVFVTIARKRHSETVLRRGPGLLPRSPGPWGSIDGSREWDDGVFSAVKQIHVHVSSHTGVISALRFEYQKRDGTAFWSPMHGGPGEDIVKKIEIDGLNEFLIGIEGFYSPIEQNGGLDVIRSLTFHTNEGYYGPMGSEIGTYFSSMSSMASNGKLVGFHGRSGTAYLYAIGVHTEYL